MKGFGKPALLEKLEGDGLSGPLKRLGSFPQREETRNSKATYLDWKTE